MSAPVIPPRDEKEPKNPKRRIQRLAVTTLAFVSAAVMYVAIFLLTKSTTELAKIIGTIIFAESAVYVLIIFDYAFGVKIIAKIRNLRLGSTLQTQVGAMHPAENTKRIRLRKSLLKREPKSKPAYEIRSRNAIERFAYNHMAKRLPRLTADTFEQSGIPLIYESYLSTAFLLSSIATLPAFVVSLLVETRLWNIGLDISLLASSVLAGVVFAISLFLWLLYPIQRTRTYKTKLENQLAYAFGILGVLSAAGMSVERLFQRIASSESNPVLSELAKRFLRNIKVFGLDTESALIEVAEHSPSQAFAKMLESIAIAFKTTGSIHDLVMFESSRLLTEKRDKLKKSVSSLAVMAELYITVVVVGPIVFIVMLTIFLFLPAGGKSALPDPTLLINLLVFVGIPVISVMFVLLLDALVAKV